MSSRRIQIVSGGRVRLPTIDDPFVTSSSTSLNGFLLEQHRIPRGELSAIFSTHLVGVNIGDAYCQEWRADGKHGRMVIPPGGVSLCSQQEVWCSWDRPRTLVALAIEPEVMQQTAHESVAHRVELKPEPNIIDPVIEAFLIAMYGGIRAGSPIEPLSIEELGTGLVAFLLRRYTVRPVELRRFRGGMPAHRLRWVIEFIEESLSRELHIAELAAVAGMSPYHFGKLFKESTGWTIHQYVMNRRARRAMYLLSRRSLPIREVGIAVGLRNQSQFTRLFREQLGVTPRDYRADFL